MTSPTFHELVRPIETTRRIVWHGLTANIVLFVLVAYLRSNPHISVATALSDPLLIPCSVVSLLIAVVACRIPVLLLPDQKLRGRVARVPDPEGIAKTLRRGKVDRDAVAKITALPQHEQCLLAVTSDCFAPFIVRLALDDAIALCGFFLANNSHAFLTILPFAAAAIALNFMVSPKLESCLEQASNLSAAA